MLRAVERGEPLPLGCCAHDDALLRDRAQIEGMERLAVLQHHVVGHVDHVVDGALVGGQQPLLQPRGRRPHAHPADHRAGVARAQLRVVDLDADGVGRARDRVAEGGLADGVGGARGDLVRHAQDRQAVAAVGRHLHHERIGAGQIGGEGGAEGRVVGEHQDALVLVAQAQLALGADHALGDDAADGGGAERAQLARALVMELGADAGEGDVLPCGDVGRAADDRLRPRAGIDGGEPQAVGVGVRAQLEHAADDDVLAPRRRGAGQVGRLDALHRETVR